VRAPVRFVIVATGPTANGREIFRGGIGWPGVGDALTSTGTHIRSIRKVAGADPIDRNASSFGIAITRR